MLFRSMPAVRRHRLHNVFVRIRPELTPAVAGYADKLLELLDEAGYVSVAEVHKAFFPLASTTSAAAQTSKLLKAIEAGAAKAGVELKHLLSGAKSKGTAQRTISFEMAGAEPGLQLATPTADAVPDSARQEPKGQPLPGQGDIDVLLIAFNEHERAAVLKEFCGSVTASPPLRNEGTPIEDLGERHGLKIGLCYSAQGEAAAQRTVSDAAHAYRPRFVIAVGIAFGVDETKQAIGDVLVSRFVVDYDLRKVRDGQMGSDRLRGGAPNASKSLVEAITLLNQRQRGRADWPVLRIGGLLSGGQLIDRQSYRD